MMGAEWDKMGQEDGIQRQW